MMSRTSIIVGAAVSFAGAAIAQTPAMPAPAPGHVETATHTTASTTTSTPFVGARTVTKRTRIARTRVAKAPMGKVVAVQTKSGKTLHYDCGKPGNKTKAACKG